MSTSSTAICILLTCLSISRLSMCSKYGVRLQGQKHVFVIRYISSSPRSISDYVLHKAEEVPHGVAFVQSNAVVPLEIHGHCQSTAFLFRVQTYKVDSGRKMLRHLCESFCFSHPVLSFSDLAHNCFVPVEIGLQ